MTVLRKRGYVREGEMGLDASGVVDALPLPPLPPQEARQQRVKRRAVATVISLIFIVLFLSLRVRQALKDLLDPK